MEIRADSANELFAKAVSAVNTNGTPIAPRGLGTREILFAHLTLTAPRRRFIGPETGRRISPGFAIAEALWIISGSNGDWIHQYNTALRDFVGPGAPEGAYGPRLRRWEGAPEPDQLKVVARRLREDMSTRRAVVQIFNPAVDHFNSIDVPCTLNHRFFCRHGRLYMHTTMRSQDLWLGLPYDLFTNTILLELMATWIGVELGEYSVSIDSMHLYDRHAQAAQSIRSIEPEGDDIRSFAIDLDSLDSTLFATINGEAGPQEGWSDAAAVLDSFRLWRSQGLEIAVSRLASTQGRISAALIDYYKSRG